MQHHHQGVVSAAASQQLQMRERTGIEEIFREPTKAHKSKVWRFVKKGDGKVDRTCDSLLLYVSVYQRVGVCCSSEAPASCLKTNYFCQ